MINYSRCTCPFLVASIFGWSLLSADPGKGSELPGALLSGQAMDMLQPQREPLGPSNRRTGLIISEIMYHPASRADGKNLEFIEIFNSDPTFIKIGGYSLGGAIQFTFPENQVIGAGEFLVVAKSPADVASVYGLSQVLGGWSGDLPDSSGTLRLLNHFGAVLWETEYDSVSPWPVAADGAGASLVLARPSFGEKESRAWLESADVGGSPGREDVFSWISLRAIKINEVLVNSGESAQDFIELYNHSNQSVDLEGCVLTDAPNKNRYIFPARSLVAPGGFLALNQEELGFGLKSAGEKLCLYGPDRKWVLDAVRIDGQAQGISSGCFPDGSGMMRALSRPTPGASNGDILVSEVVINEIMYHPVTEEDDDQYVEIYNRGTNSVELSGWRFTKGIDFDFPAGTLLPAGGYGVVARNADRLRSRYPQLNAQNTWGNFKGKLSGRGDRLVLSRPERTVIPGSNGQPTTNVFYVAVNEVTYGTGGRWGQWSDGGGSSLELIDARSDNRLPSNWADSDETAKAPWTLVEHTGVLDLGVGTANSLQVFMQGAGECLVDEVEVLAEGGTNLVANSTFNTGTEGWVMQGTHDRSSWESTEGCNSPGSLHIRADGRGDTGANRIRTSLLSPRPVVGKNATIRARVRWLKGVPGILLRFYGNWLEAAGTLETPVQCGTPGARNSRAVVNAGPAITEVRHWPILPAAQENVVVSARVYDPDGLSKIVLNYRLDPGSDLVSVPMTDDGKEGDGVAQDGIFSAIIPGQAAGVLVAFHVEAADRLSPAGTALFPQDAPGRECLVRFGETPIPGQLGSYRVWLTKAASTKWTQRLKLHNTPLDITFVSGDCRVIYNAGGTYAGSPFIRPSYTGPVGIQCGYELEFPADDGFLGDNGLTLDFPTRDDTLQLEQVAYWMGDQLGVSNNRRRFVHLVVNGTKRGKIYEDCQKPGKDLLRQFFPEDANGDLFKLDDGFEFTDGATDFTRDNGDTAATLEKFTTTGGEKKTARYRWHWRKRAESGSVHDYASLFALVDAMNGRGDAYPDQVKALVDVDQWMRVLTVEHLVGNWDSYGYRRGKNMFAYKPVNGKWQLLMWDIDFVMSAQGDPATASMFSVVDPVIRRMLNQPVFARAYYQAMREAVDGPLLSSNVGPLLDAKYAALRTNGITASQPTAAKSYLQSRRSNLLSILNSMAIDFSVISNGGGDFSTNRNWVELIGTAPIDLKTIRVNGIEYPVQWQNVVVWSVRLPLSARTNLFSIQGYDTQGKPWSSAPRAITITCTGATEKPEDCLVINEIMYRPALPGAQFVEIYNTSSQSAFDLAGYRMEGLAFTFAPGTVIGPREYLVIVQARAPFMAAYGADARIAGEFKGQLNPEGEILRLVKPGVVPGTDQVIDEVAYSSQFPWPQAANGSGGSLQLIDPAQDHKHPANWGAITPAEASRPDWRFVSVTGTASTNSHLLVYHSPYQEPRPYNDISGDWAGVITAGGPFEFSASFQTQSNGWTGSVDLGSEIPLTSVKVETNSVKFSFTYSTTSIRWEGRLTPDGQVIKGTYYESGYSFPFTLTRQTDPADYPGGEVSLDDLELVAGTVPEVGVNLVNNSDFEFPLTNSWQVASNHSGSVVTNGLSHSGQSSLRLSASWGGRDEQSALWQDVSSLLPGQTYTLSYWYLPSNKGRELTVRLAGSDIAATHSISPPTAATPGAVNSVESRGHEIFPVRLSEIQLENLSGPSDGQGHRAAWVEIFNPGNQEISLRNCYLSSRTNQLQQWAFPTNAVIQPGQYKLVWLDAAPGETTAAEWHANFIPTLAQGWIILSRDNQGQQTVLDSLVYQGVAPGQSFGLWPDGQKAVFSVPTPGQVNQAEFGQAKVWINEWMANNVHAVMDASSGRYSDWFELYNPSASAVDLSGYWLTDDLRKKSWVAPVGTRIEAGGFMVVWADGDGAPRTGPGQLSVSFKLDLDGEVIGLFSPEGHLVDSVTFGPQPVDVSQGRWPDGGDGTYRFMGVPTPGAPNRVESESGELRMISLSARADGSWVLEWASQPGRGYQVQYKEQLSDPSWENLGLSLTATGTHTSWTDQSKPMGRQRFYRVEQIQ